MVFSKPNQTLTKCLFSVGFLTGAKRRDLSPSIGFFWGSSLGKKLGRDLSPGIGFLEFFIREKTRKGFVPNIRFLVFLIRARNREGFVSQYWNLGSEIVLNSFISSIFFFFPKKSGILLRVFWVLQDKSRAKPN